MSQNISDQLSNFQYQDNQQLQIKRCVNMLQKIDINRYDNRKWLVDSYRKLDKILRQNKTQKYILKQQLSQLPNLLTKYAFNIRAYKFQQGIQTFTKVACESGAGKRKCQVPIIYKANNGKYEQIRFQNSIAEIRENNVFNIKIQAQQYSTIIITYQDNHPLLVKNQYRQYFKQSALIQITPPVTMGIVVVKEQQYFIDSIQQNGLPLIRSKVAPFKLNSNCLKLIIKKTSSHQAGRTQFIRRLGDQHMIRPDQTFDHGMSSYGSIVHPFISIQQDSRSRSRD